MKNRCFNPKCDFYHRYGGRGITVCPAWSGDFLVFYYWATENGYKEGLTLDRIDNDGNYEPSNCRWATTKEQANNKSTRREVEYAGKTKSLSEWAEEYDISQDALRTRINNGWDMQDALTLPIASPRSKVLNIKGHKAFINALRLGR